MRLAVASDLHSDVSGYMPEQLLDEPADMIIIAGDLHPSDTKRDRFLWQCESHYKVPVFYIPGNHDYWGPTPAQKPCRDMVAPNGMKVAGATLWTRLKPHEWVRYILDMNDYRNMYKKMNWEEGTYTAAHEAQRRFLLRSGAEIIVSHHAPSWQSVHEQYKNDDLNCAYVNDMDAEILGLPNPPKLWIHGHVHQSHDYMIGNTRVLCHPRGYPFEANFKNYRAKVIDI